MRRRRFLATSLAYPLSAIVQGPSRRRERLSTPLAFPWPLKTSTLGNGLTVVTWSTVVRAGVRDEVGPGGSGIAQVVRCLVSGTGDTKRHGLSPAVACRESSTSLDATCFRTAAPSSAVAALAGLEARRLSDPPAGGSELRAAARAALTAYRRAATSPTQPLEEALRAHAYTVHPYRRTLLGTPCDLEALADRLPRARSFFERTYRPDRTAVIVAGDVDHDRLVREVDRAFGSWRGGGQPADVPVEPPQSVPRSARLRWPGPAETTVLLGYHIPAGVPSDPDATALRVLAEAVFGPTSPLYQALVVDEQQVVELKAEARWTRDPGLFTVRARVRKPDDLADVRSRIESALAQAGEEPVSLFRLSQIRDHLRNEICRQFGGPEDVARVLAASFALTGRHDAWGDYLGQVAWTSPGALQYVAARYLVPGGQTSVTLVPEARKR